MRALPSFDRLHALSMVVAGTALLSAPALALAEPSDRDMREHARSLTAQAELAYHAGRFDEAARGYERAYAAFPDPQLLFNIGQCHRRLERPAQALRYFEAYLREQPDGPQHALTVDLIAEMRAALRARAMDAAEASPRPAIASHHVSTTRMPLSPMPDTTVIDEDDDAGIHESWVFWATVGVLAAGITVATVLAIREQEAEPPRATGTLGSVQW